VGIEFASYEKLRRESLQNMRPAKSAQGTEQGELYQRRLSTLLDQSHPLYVLAEAINWEFFVQEFGALYVEQRGRPGLPMRLLVGLHYLKHLYDVSDERVVAGFVENPYWQYFCGEEFFVHELPCNPTSLVKWRQRIGPERMEQLLAETIAAAQRQQALKPAELRRVNVDTTVQEKAIAFPTDARLYHKARCVLVREAQRAGLELRQSYRRVGKRALQKQGRYASAQQLKRARKETKRLRTYLGRVIRDIERKAAAKGQELSPQLSQAVERASRIHRQQREDKHKLYSMQAPEVECIAKGKEHKKYEFGCKVSVATTSKRGWVVGIKALHGNPYDGHTLKGAHAQVAKLTGVKPEALFVDRGYRGAQHHPEDTKVYLSGRKLSGRLKRLLRRRAAIEPVIGHLKQDHRMKRNYLQGPAGDEINALLVGSGFNLRKLLRVFFWPIFGWVEQKLEIKLPLPATA
jgi:transposase, IS5 family